MSTIGWAGTCGTGYANNLKITLGKPGSTLTNWLMTFNGTYPFLRTSGNGGGVVNTVANGNGIVGPADMVFCPDNTLTGTPMSYEVYAYSATTGNIRGVVNTITASSSSNSTFYIYWGNASVSTSQQDLTTGTFDSTKSLYHLDDNAATTAVIDSLGASGGVAAANTSTATVAGAIGTAMGTTAMPITVANTSQLISGTGTRTLSCWVRSTGSVSDQFFCGYGPGLSNGNSFYIFDSSGTHTIQFAGYAADVNFSVSVDDNQWHYAVVVYDNAASPKIKTYLDGAATGTGSPTLNTTATNFLIGKPQWASTCTNCKADEVKLENVARTPDWIAATFQNLNVPGGFYKIEPYGSAPSVLQVNFCANNGGTLTCTFPAPATPGATISIMAQQEDVNSGACPTVISSQSFTYTLKNSSNSTGGLHSFNACMYTAPVTASGTETITYPGASPGSQAGSLLYVAEVYGMGTTVAVSGTATDGAAPLTTTVSVPTADSMTFCHFAGGSARSTAFNQSGFGNYREGTFGAGGQPYAYANGTLGSGSQSCIFTTAGGSRNADAMTVFGPSSAQARKGLQGRTF